MEMSYRNKLLFIVIVTIAIIVSVMIAISWMNSNKDGDFWETYGFYAYGQSNSTFANCITLMMKGDAVQLNMDDDCNEAQWNEAVAYYKANGYPNEESYMDMFGSKFIQLSSDKWVQDQVDLDDYLKENM